MPDALVLGVLPLGDAAAEVFADEPDVDGEPLVLTEPDAVDDNPPGPGFELWCDVQPVNAKAAVPIINVVSRNDIVASRNDVTGVPERDIEIPVIRVDRAFGRRSRHSPRPANRGRQYG